MHQLERWRRSVATHPALVDGLIAAAFLPLSLIARWRDLTTGTRPADLWSVVAITSCWAAFAIRRTHALVALSLAVLGVSAAAVVNEPDLGLVLVAALVIYGAAASRVLLVPSARLAVFASLAIVAVRAVSTSVHGRLSDAVSGLLVDAALLGLAIAFAATSRQRQTALDELELRNVLLERDRARDATMIVAEERRRIAREMHDVVAHAVTIIVLQADGAMGRAATEPDLVDQSLLAIQHSGRSALDDLRRVLGVLRETEAEDRREPLPDLTDLDSLATSFPDLTVTMTRSGDVSSVGPGVALASYRIVQEALTNALRHGQARSVIVDVRVGESVVELEVTDDGISRGVSNPDGHGLVGMRERVAACHGTLEVGPRAGRGWRIRARLMDTPYGATP